MDDTVPMGPNPDEIDTVPTTPPEPPAAKDWTVRTLDTSGGDPTLDPYALRPYEQLKDLCEHLDDEDDTDDEAEAEPEHPKWCDLEYCEVHNKPGGVFHRSVPKVIASPKAGPVVTAWRAFNADEGSSFMVLRIAQTDPLGQPETVTTHWFALRAALRLSMVANGLCGGASSAVFVPGDVS